MIAFIKNNSLIMIKKKLFILYLLNVTDILFTVLLLRTGYFSEINLVMSAILKNPLLCIIIKVFFPAVLLYYMYQQIADTQASQRRTSNIAVNISLVIYGLVNISHLIWTASLPFLNLYL